VIHYHGGPIWPLKTASDLWVGRHGLTSFEHPEQVATMAEVCQSFVLDNGAFSKWRAGEGRVDVDAFAEFVRQWERHPGFDFALIPDVIDGDEQDNAKMRASWLQQMPRMKRPAVPVWHLHESLDLLAYLIRCVESGVYERIAFGSSGRWSTPGTDDWWQRMEEVREVACDSDGIPHVKLHGLRMLNPTIFSHIPLASADSCNIALNIGKDSKWSKGQYPAVTPTSRAFVLAHRIEHHVVAVRWSRRVGIQQNLELLG
jgi:hypothetical protein